jgi:hypothetical protein
MPDRLGDFARGVVRVECTRCRRLGCYDVRRLHIRYGLDMADLDLLRVLTASCRHQQQAGAPAPRQYVAVCQARITMPAAPIAPLPTPGCPPFTIETWYPGGTSLELHLGSVYRLDMAEAAFQVVCGVWTATPVTVRQGARIVLERKP